MQYITLFVPFYFQDHLMSLKVHFAVMYLPVPLLIFYSPFTDFHFCSKPFTLFKHLVLLTIIEKVIFQS